MQVIFFIYPGGGGKHLLVILLPSFFHKPAKWIRDIVLGCQGTTEASLLHRGNRIEAPNLKIPLCTLSANDSYSLQEVMAAISIFKHLMALKT